MAESHVPEENVGLTVKTVNGKNEYTRKKSVWDGVTMEPLWFGAIMSLTMGFMAFQNLFLRQACTVDLGYSEEECFHSNGTNRTIIEMQSQQIVSSLSVVSNFVGGVITCVVLLFLGPWSDSSGRRKPVIIIPIIGMMATSVGLLVLQAFPKVSTAWAIYMEVLPLSIGGSNHLLMMATFSYLGDICYKTGRCTTTVMGSNSAAISASTILGSLLAPVLLRNLGFVGVFGISAVLEGLLAAVLGFFPVGAFLQVSSLLRIVTDASLCSIIFALWKVKDVNVARKIPPIWDLTLPLQALKCMFKKREGNKRKNVILMVLVPSTTTITFATEITLLYLYLRFKFQWTEVEYGMFSAIRGLTHFIGTVLIIKVLKHKLKLKDETIGLIGGISQFLGSSSLILSSQSWMVFMSPVLGILSRAVLIAEKPVLNKQIVASEQGKLNSITAILDKVLAFGVIPLTHYLYSVTISWMPEFFLLLSLLAASIQIVSYSLVTDESGNKKHEDSIDSP